MERKFYKEVWAIRFNKMLELENKAVTEYQALLEECKRKHKGHSIEAHLERLIKDEKKHAGLVQELITILDSQKD